MTDLRARRVWVTGGHGFLGSHVCERLQAAGAEVVAPSHAELELRDAEATASFAERLRPEIAIHLAARVGGIGANERHPGTFWRDNTLMGASVLEAARRGGAQRLVVVGTVCAYPKFTPVPFAETDLWSGYPEETNAAYGVAKRALATGLLAYRTEFGLGGCYLLPANLYGPRDDFRPSHSHVIPALVRKCVEAKAQDATEIEVWGTGSASREFLFVDDCAEAIVLAAAKIDDPAPMNLGTGCEVTIRELVAAVAAATGFTGKVRWNPARPDGQPRRSLDVGQAERLLGWRAATPLDVGLMKTVAWYEAQSKHHE